MTDSRKPWAKPTIIELTREQREAAEKVLRLVALEACAEEHRCWRYKARDECNCLPGRLVHGGGCSNVNALRRCATDCRCPS